MIKRRVGAVLQRLFQAARNFHDDNCLDLTAVVTFYSLLSLGPVLFLLGTILSRWFPDRNATEQALVHLDAFLPVEAGAVVHRLASELRGNESWLVLVMPVMIWVGTSSLSALEYAVNVAFGRSGARKRWHSRLKALLVLAGGCALLGISVLLNTLLPQLDRYRSMIGLTEAPELFVGWGSYLFLMVVSFLAFWLFYTLLPRGKIGWKPAAWGALVALCLWEAARRLFAGVLLRSPTYGLLPGALAGIVAFLLWIYTAVAITLVGAELVAVLNGNRRIRKRPSAGEA